VRRRGQLENVIGIANKGTIKTRTTGTMKRKTCSRKPRRWIELRGFTQIPHHSPALELPPPPPEAYAMGRQSTKGRIQTGWKRLERARVKKPFSRTEVARQ